MNAFTVITGIASLLGLFLQLRDAFPEHRETRKAIVLLVLGTFVGSLIASLLGSAISLAIPLSPFALLVGVFGSVLAILAVIAAFCADPVRRSDLFEVTGVGLVAFLIVLFFGALFTSAPNRSQDLTIDELVDLANVHTTKGNIDRAIALLERAKSSVPRSDIRHGTLQRRIEELKAKQVLRE